MAVTTQGRCTPKNFIPVVVAVVAMFCSLGSNTWCHYVKLQTKGSYELPKFGIWYHTDYETYENWQGNIEVRETCTKYPDEVRFDSKWKSAKAFSVMAPVFGGLATFFTGFALVFNMGETRWRLCATGFFLACLFQGLTFLFLKSKICSTDNPIIPDLENIRGGVGTIDYDGLECKLEWGGKASISAVVLFFVTGVVMLAIPAPRYVRSNTVTEQTVTYTRTVVPDGNPVVVKGVEVREIPLGKDATSAVEVTVAESSYIPGDVAEEVAPS